MQICRICLATDIKLNKIRGTLKEMYKQAIGLNVTPDDNLPQKLCWECVGRLTSFSRLRNKAYLSHRLMVGLLQSSCSLTMKSLRTIDRRANYLSSTLILKVFDPNHSNIHLHDISSSDVRGNGQTSVTLLEKDNPDLDLEVKEEIETNGLEIMDDNSISSSDVVLAQHRSMIKVLSVERKNKKKKEKQVPKIDRRRKPANEVLSEDIFSITDLTYEEQVSEIQKRQNSANYKNSEYKCTDCFKGFLDEDAFKGHIVRHTSQIGVFQCDICKIHFKSQHALRNHTTSHMQKFSCKKCLYVTTRRHAAKLHEGYHNGTRYQCPHCQEDFVKFSTYMSHIRIKHPSDFVCEMCGYSYISAKGLGLHKKLKHRFDDQPIPADGPHCDKCDVRFQTEEALERHLKLSTRHRELIDQEDSHKKVHLSRDIQKCQAKEQNDDQKKRRRNNHSKPEGPIPCEQCDQQLPDSLSYYRHFRRSHPDKNRTNYPSMKSKSMCEVCGKMFQSLALLQDHSFTHTESKQFVCCECGKRFQRRYRLIAHRRVHAALPPRHACAACGKRFSTNSNMQRHMVSHTGLKPFKCEMCGKCFKHASEKRVHITYVHLKKPWPKRSRGKRRGERQSHTGLKPFKCEMCGKCFKHASEKRVHITYVHLKKPWPKRSRGKRRGERQSHTGLKPFKCEMCGKCFKHASEKRVHITYVHLKKPWPKRSRGKRRGERQSQPTSCDIAAGSDPKVPDALIHEKHNYYNLKI